MMNQSKENQSGCSKPRKNVDEGIGNILESLEAYICDVVCFCNNLQLTQEERDQYCDQCRMSKKVDEIEAEYEEINDFSKALHMHFLRNTERSFSVKTADIEYLPEMEKRNTAH